MTKSQKILKQRKYNYERNRRVAEDRNTGLNDPAMIPHSSTGSPMVEQAYNHSELSKRVINENKENKTVSKGMKIKKPSR